MINNKKVSGYILPEEYSAVGHIPIEKFEIQPATALLEYMLSAQNAIEKCKELFEKRPGGRYLELTRESQIAIQNLINSTLASIMGYFEMYEKYLFAAMFEKSVYLKSFTESHFFRMIFGHTYDKVEIPFTQLTAYRSSAVSTGLIIANSLGNWHNPEKVNGYFKAFGLKVNAFSGDDIADLSVLWQLRHSIVHNGATITKADAQKISELKEFGDKKIVLSNKFIYDLSKTMHSMVFNVNKRLENAYMQDLVSTITDDEKESVSSIFKVVSPNTQWLH